MKLKYWLVIVFCIFQSWATDSVAQDIDYLHPPLGTEGLFDTDNPALKFLQQPSEAMRDFPTSSVGNHVDWVDTMDQELIKPRMSINQDKVMRAISLDVIMSQTGSMPFVRFPHFDHTQLLSCTNCHTQIFLPKKDANPVSMYAILNGEFCGVCHGKVAFPLTDCFRCHSIRRDRRVLDE